jgi:hypothetical protein
LSINRHCYEAVHIPSKKLSSKLARSSGRSSEAQALAGLPENWPERVLAAVGARRL